MNEACRTPAGVTHCRLGQGTPVPRVVRGAGHGETGFGDPPTEQSLRIVIPAVTSIALGVQSMFAGFALGVLRLKVR